MNDLRKAAGEALEALEDVPYMSNKDDYERLERVKTALRQALETEQEPVAWINWNAATGEESIDKYCDSELASVPLYRLPKNLSPLTENQILEILPDAQHGWTTATYGKWVARAVERLHGIRGKSLKINNEITQEAVECLCGLCKLGKREWVGLTADEVYECWMSGDVVAAVEAKLKEKNT